MGTLVRQNLPVKTTYRENWAAPKAFRGRVAPNSNSLLAFGRLALGEADHLLSQGIVRAHERDEVVFGHFAHGAVLQLVKRTVGGDQRVEQLLGLVREDAHDAAAKHWLVGHLVAQRHVLQHLCFFGKGAKKIPRSQQAAWLFAEEEQLNAGEIEVAPHDAAVFPRVERGFTPLIAAGGLDRFDAADVLDGERLGWRG